MVKVLELNSAKTALNELHITAFLFHSVSSIYMISVEEQMKVQLSQKIISPAHVNVVCVCVCLRALIVFFFPFCCFADNVMNCQNVLLGKY